MSTRILVVCAANICRSPLAEMLLARALDGQGVQVRSAGTHARDSDGICSLVRERLAEDIWASALTRHRSRLLTSSLLEGSALVLVATRDIRAEVVRLEPSARERVFTLREAAHLGLGFDSQETAASGDLIGDYVAYLDHSRARVGSVPVPRRRWGRGRSADLLSIADGHQRGSRAHRRALEETNAATSIIIGQLAARAGTKTSHRSQLRSTLPRE